MPQVHNKQLAMQVDSNAFGKNSRYMSSLKYSEGTKRRINVFNKLENKLNRYRLRYFNRHAEIYQNKHQRQKKELINNLKRTIAYKVVCSRNSITNSLDYDKALDKNYSQYAFRHEIDHMVSYLAPERVRERKADGLIDENRKRYQMLLQRNRKSIDLICPPKPKWRGYLIKDETDDDYEDIDGSETSSVTSESKQKNKETIPQKDKLPPLSRSPTKPVLPLRKQGITKAFMIQREKTRSNQSPVSKPLSDATGEHQKYELPPLQIRKKMDQRLQIATNV